MMVTKGTFQVLGKSFSPEAFLGFAGIGHTGMLAGLLLLFFLIRQAKTQRTKRLIGLK